MRVKRLKPFKNKVKSMFDETTPIKRGAVVSCCFPHAENENSPGPSARPALIVRTFFDRNDNRWKAIVAYGTSRTTRANAGFEIRLRKPEHLEAAGLHRPTRFTMSRMRILPIDREFFAFAQTGSPVLGYLPDDLMKVLDRNCEKLIAITGDLRPLMGGAQTSVASGETEDAAPRPQVQEADFDTRRVDQFLLSACNGRRNLGGAAPQAAQASGAPRTYGSHLRRR